MQQWKIREFLFIQTKFLMIILRKFFDVLSFYKIYFFVPLFAIFSVPATKNSRISLMSQYQRDFISIASYCYLRITNAIKRKDFNWDNFFCPHLFFFIMLILIMRACIFCMIWLMKTFFCSYANFALLNWI